MRVNSGGGCATTIERARAAVLATLRARGPVSARAAQTIVRLEAADQIFLALIGLSEVLAATGDAAVRAAAEGLLRRLEPLLTLIGRGIETDDGRAPAAPERHRGRHRALGRRLARPARPGRGGARRPAAPRH